MLNMLSNLTKAVVKTAVLPVSLAADVVTLGGTLTDTESMTKKNLEGIGESLDKVLED